MRYLFSFSLPTSLDSGYLLGTPELFFEYSLKTPDA